MRAREIVSALFLPCLVMALGCAHRPPAPREAAAPRFVAEVVSDPAPAVVSMKGRELGPTPLTVPLTLEDDVLSLTAAIGSEEPVEERIRFLSADRAEVRFIFGADRSTMARVLGLARVLVFDYGAGLTFDVDRADLKQAFLPLLDRQAELLVKYFPTLEAHVCGHTDSSGGRDHNQLLSLERANAVAAYLATHGVPKERLKSEGFGSDYPVASNDTPEGKALNRRTEIILPR